MIMWADQTFCKTLDRPAYSSSSAQITMLYSPGSANVGRSRYVLDAARRRCQGLCVLWACRSRRRAVAREWGVYFTLRQSHCERHTKGYIARAHQLTRWSRRPFDRLSPRRRMQHKATILKASIGPDTRLLHGGAAHRMPSGGAWSLIRGKG